MARTPINKPTTKSAVLKLPANTGRLNMAKPKDRFSLRYLAILLAIISFLVYANTLQNGYVMDDATVITRNTIVTKGVAGIPELLVTSRLKGFALTDNEESYRPIPLIMYAIEYQVFGANATEGHLFNIVSFICCVLSLFFFLNKLLNDKIRIAFIASLLFAIHPIHTEVVANIKSRDELLCFLFAFLSLIMFIDYTRLGKLPKLLMGALMLFLSLLSKETSIAFLLIIPLVFFFYINDNRRRSIHIITAALAVTICFLAIRGLVLNGHHANNIVFLSNPLITAGLTSRVATAIMVLGMYLKLLFIPYPLVCDYSYNSIPIVDFENIFALASLALYLSLAVVSIYRLIKIRKDPWAFGILFFLGTIALFSNIPFLVYSEMAERFLFFASAGFCLLIALAFERWAAKPGVLDLSTIKNKTAYATITGVCIIFSVLTVMRNSDWKDNYTLFTSDLKKSANDCELYFYVATEISQNISSEESNAVNNAETGRQSLYYLDKAIAIYPDFDAAHAETGRIYNYLYMFDSGIIHDKEALAINPINSIASYDLAMADYFLKQYTEAIAFFKKTISLQPGFELAYINLGRCYSNIKQYDSAIIYFNKVLDIDPGFELAKQGIEIANLLKSKEDSASKH